MDVDKLESTQHCWWKWTMVHFENQFTVPQNIKHRVTIWLVGAVIYLREMKTYALTETYTQMFIAALFTISKRWKQPKCPWTDECINKRWYSHTVEYYSATKKNEVLIYATTWLKPWKHAKWKKPVTMDHILWFLLYEITRIGKSTEPESRLVVTRGWREREWLLSKYGMFFSSLKAKGGNCTTL